MVLTDLTEGPGELSDFDGFDGFDEKFDGFDGCKKYDSNRVTVRLIGRLIGSSKKLPICEVVFIADSESPARTGSWI